MSDRSGIFAGEDPFDLARGWRADAAKSEPNDPDAASLATVDEHGIPNVRIVLVREVDADAFIFYTNYTSVKGMELGTNPFAALGFHWKSLRRQLRVRGSVEQVSQAKSDEYFSNRPPESRLGAWASHQSKPLNDRGELEQALDQARQEHGAEPARPPHWGGFRLIPNEIEFWADGTYRLHDRFRWRREKGDATWKISRLNP